MKKVKIYIKIFMLFLKRNNLMRYYLMTILLISAIQLLADTPPNPGGGPGSGDLPVGGSTPIGSGFYYYLLYIIIYVIRVNRKTIVRKMNLNKFIN